MTLTEISAPVVTRLPNLSAAAAIILIVHLLPATAQQSYELGAEKQIVLQNRISPMEAMLEAYNESQVLVLGLANHRHSTPFHYLGRLLEEVGDDPMLKIIAIEWMRDHSGVFEGLSTKSLATVLHEYEFPSEHEKQLYLCTSHEKAYSIGAFMPTLRVLNGERPGNEIIVHAIDGSRSDKKFSWPYMPFSDIETQHTDCKLQNSRLYTRFTSTENRERKTAQNFAEQVWNTLGPDDKVIVLYHLAHLFRDFRSCNSTMQADLTFSTGIGPTSWLQVFMEEQPSAKEAIKIVFLDEKDANHHPFGVFQTIWRNTHSNETSPWAINLDHLNGLDLERGSEMFMPNNILVWQKEGMIYSYNRIYDIADYIIVTPNAESEFIYRTDAQEFYLTSACSSGRYDGQSLFTE